MSAGNGPLPSFWSKAFVADPYGAYDHLRVTAPVRRIHREGVPMWLVTSYAEARTVLTDDRFRKDPDRWPISLEQSDPGLGAIAHRIGKHLLYTDPPQHTRLRRLVSKTFTPRRIAGYESMTTTIVDALLDQFDGAAEVDLVARYAVPIGVTVICELLGVPAGERRDFWHWSLQLAADDERAGADAAASRSDAVDRLGTYLSGLIAAKRARPTTDLLSDLVHARDDEGRLSERELVAMALLLLLAGHETTINLIGNGVLVLLQEPDHADALRQHPELLPTAVEEIVRHHGSVMISSLRVTAEPVELGGVQIPAGELVMAAVGAADRDPAQFPDPNRFDPGRQPNPHLGFGAGIHYCIGAPLARMQTAIAIGALLRRHPRMTLAVPVADLRWHPSIVVRGLHALPVRLGAPADRTRPVATAAAAAGIGR